MVRLLRRRSWFVVGWLLVTAGVVGAQGIPGDVPEVAIDPIMDGADSFAGEWTDALIGPDSFTDPYTGASPAGKFYYEKKTGWTATSSSGGVTTYPGTTFFLAHDIYGAAAGGFAAFRANDASDWNYVKVRRPSGAVVECWCFGGFAATPTPPHALGNDLNEPDDGLWLADAAGLGPSILIPEPSATGGPTDLIDDVGFIVRLNGNPASDRHWFPGMPEPGDAGWDWDDFYGCFARAGFNSTFFDTGTDVPDSHSSPNEVYEWCFHGAAGLEPPLDCTEWHIEWIDPPKRAVIYIAPNWFIHFGPPPVPASRWPLLAALGALLALGGWWIFRQRRLGTVVLLALALAAGGLLVSCGGSKGPVQDKRPPVMRVPPLVPRNAFDQQPYPVPVGPVVPVVQAQVIGGTAPYTFTQTGGQLPPGIVFTSDGRLTSNGAPLPIQAAQTYDFDFQVTDANNLTATSRSSVRVDPTPFVPIELVQLSLTPGGPPSLLTGTVNQDTFGVIKVRLPDPIQPTQFNFNPTASPDPLPPGMQVFPGGVVRGLPTNPTAGSGPNGANVIVVDVVNGAFNGQVTLQIDINP